MSAKQDGDGSSKDGSGKLKIAVLGMGHVGLPTALGLAELGWEVIGADDDRNKIAVLKAGKAPFFEPAMQELLTKHLRSGLFQPTDDVEAAVRAVTVLYVCVGTPQKESGEADLSQVEAVIRVIARNLNGYKLIVEKSTVPASTAEWIKKTVARYAQVVGAAPSKEPSSNGNHSPAQASPVVPDFDVASNPEFLQEGTAIQNFFHPDRVVIGVESERAQKILETIYRPLNCKILTTNVSTAELIKHAANAFLATKISYINMVADLCEKLDADVVKVAEGLGLDPRIGPAFFSAGIGFGGYCLPKDVRAFAFLAEEQGVDAQLLKAVEQINGGRIDHFVRRVREALWVLQGKKIAVLGLAFKPNTDDIREAPSLKVIEALLKEGACLQLYDPQAMQHTKAVLPEMAGRLTYSDSAYEAVRGAHALVLLTEWEEFKHLDLSRLREVMAVPVIVDGRNLYEPEAMRKAGFEYLCVGRQGLGYAQPASLRTHSAQTEDSEQSLRNKN